MYGIILAIALVVAAFVVALISVVITVIIDLCSRLRAFIFQICCGRVISMRGE